MKLILVIILSLYLSTSVSERMKANLQARNQGQNSDSNVKRSSDPINVIPITRQTNYNYSNQVGPTYQGFQQQPILLNGGSLSPLNVYHNPIWLKSQENAEIGGGNSYNSQLPQTNGGAYPSSDAMNSLQRPVNVEEYVKVSPLIHQKVVVGGNPNTPYSEGKVVQRVTKRFQGDQQQPKFLSTGDSINTYPQYSGRDNQDLTQMIPYGLKMGSFRNNFLEHELDFVGDHQLPPECVKREGMLKIRDVDQKEKDVIVSYSVLTKDRLSYFSDPKDESSIQGSIELSKIKESLKLINGYPTCFSIKTIDNVSDCSICAENADSARDWINSITQNAVNCNTMSALNDLNKHGLLS